MVIINNNISAKAGLIQYPGPRQELKLPKVSTDVINQGDLLFADNLNTKLWKVCGTAGTEKGPFAVCTKAAANGDLVVSAVVSGAIATVTAGGAIPVGSFVKPSVSTAGRVDQWIAPTGSVVNSNVTDIDRINLKVGVYLKQAKVVPQGDGLTLPVDAALNDVVEILLL